MPSVAPKSCPPVTSDQPPSRLRAQPAEGRGRAGATGVLEQHDELVAAEPGHGVDAAGGGVRRWATDSQHGVADRVAERVVDGLELVQVDHDDRRRAQAALGAGDRGVAIAASTARRLPRPVSGSRVAARASAAAIRRISNSAITWSATSRSRPSCTVSSVPGRSSKAQTVPTAWPSRVSSGAEA